MTRVQALKERVNRSAARELDRCRRVMGDEAWREHGEWVKAYVLAELRDWMQVKAAKGEL